VSLWAPLFKAVRDAPQRPLHAWQNSLPSTPFSVRLAAGCTQNKRRLLTVLVVFEGEEEVDLVSVV
jgi:hypothetical protein